MRHADAGYESAIEVAKEKGIKIPMITGKGDKNERFNYSNIKELILPKSTERPLKGKN